MALVPPFFEMGLKGVYVDQSERSIIREQLSGIRNDAVERLNNFAGRKIMGKKTISSQQLIKLLYEDMGLPVQKNPKTKRPAAGKLELQKLEKHVTDDVRPVFLDILTVRELGVQITNFLDVKLDRDGRLRWTNNVAGTETGRISTSSNAWGTGAGVQNWKEICRRIVVADPGELFIYPDGEQAEARCVAFLSEDRDLIRLFESGKNPYFLMANLMFDIPYDQMTKERREYPKAKQGSHGTHYGLGEYKLALMLGCTVAEAREIKYRYLALFPGVQSNFQGKIRSQLERTRTLTTPFGRTRTFYGRQDEEMMRAGFAQVPQSTVADWLDMGLLRLYRFTRGLFSLGKPESAVARYLEFPDKPKFVSKRDDMQIKIRPTIQIHDGLKTTTHWKTLTQGIDVCKEALTFEIPFESGPLTIPTDVKIGWRWGDLKKPTPEWIAECIAMAKRTEEKGYAAYSETGMA